MEALIGQEFAPLMLKRYKAAKKHPTSLVKWRRKADGTEIKDLNIGFIIESAFRHCIC
jgi:hypothetical protein